jgi:DNA-binding NarL/FixJ family response regulator
MPRILLADDHAVVRRQLREILEGEADLSVCAEASNGLEAVTLTVSLLPDIVILDLSMPELNGLEAARQIHARFPGIDLLILTMYDPLELMDEVIASGVRTCILKTDVHHLVTTVRSIWQQRQNGDCGSSLNHIPDVPSDSIPIERVENSKNALTECERQIVQMLAQAKTNKQIAASLSLTVKAVEVHRGAIMRKLKTESMFDLVRYAIRNKLVATKPAAKPMAKSLS